MNRLAVGTRGSRLALAQTQLVVEQLQASHPDMAIAMEIIRTTGDKMAAGSFRDAVQSSSKGLFVKELEEALLEGRIDLAVHSLKDMPVVPPEGLCIGAFPAREDPRDALVTDHPISSLDELAPASRLATGSLRRRVQLAHLRPDLIVEPIRGNIDTRLLRMRELQLDGVVLAAAGLRRSGLLDQARVLFPADLLIPAVGQGALALQIRAGDRAVAELLTPLNDVVTQRCVEAERLFLKQLGGGCQVPMGAHAFVRHEGVAFIAFAASPSSGEVLQARFEGESDSLNDLALQTAEYLLAHGAEAFLADAGIPNQ